jgi:ABC-type transport system substrate-binding protein
VPGLARRDLSLQRAVRLVEAAPTMSFMLMMSPAVPAFDDRRLRSALAQAIDREGLPRTLGIRRSIVARGIEHAFADPRASAAWPFDVRAARARLDSLGAARPVALRVAYTRGTPIDTLAGPAAAVGSALRAAGQAVRFVETDERYGALRDGLVDLSTLTLIPSTDEPGENLGLFGQGRGDALYGAAGRWVTARDALAQAVSRARSAAARRAALRAFDEAVARDLPVIPLWFYGRAAASRLGVTGCDAGSAARRFADLRAAPAATDGTGP